MIIITCLILFLINLLHHVIKRQRFLNKLKQFTTRKGLPLLGVALEFRDPRECLTNFLTYREECGDNFIINLGPRTILIVTEPHLVECVLGSSKLINKSETYLLMKKWFGEGLLTSQNNKWRSHRKLLTPSFHYTILEDFVQVFDQASRKLVSKLNNEIGKDSFDIFQYITLCTLDIICETAMGTAINAQDYPESDFVQSTKDMCDVLYARFFSPILIYSWFYNFSKECKKEIKSLKVLHGYTNDVIKQRRKTLIDANNGVVGELSEFGIKCKNTFLDALLKSNINGVPLTDQEIQEEVSTFMFEGHDTTAISISFTLYLLSKHLDVQEKVYEEIESLFNKDKEAKATIEILHQMKYLEMVIKESLRLYPSVPAYAREIVEDTPFKGGILPKGLEVAVVDYILHRNPNIYPNPEKFDPERFSIENSTKRHPYAYIPFSAGPRNCIGQKFAMLELKSTISKVMRYFKILPSIPEIEPVLLTSITLQSDNGINIRLIPRN